jgi:hypothetical protein
MKQTNISSFPGMLTILFIIVSCFSVHAQSDVLRSEEKIVIIDGGSLQLNNGQAVVILSPPVAQAIAEAKGNYLVSLTPVGDCGQLKVQQKSGNQFVVQEVSQQHSNASFDYLVCVKNVAHTGIIPSTKSK